MNTQRSRVLLVAVPLIAVAAITVAADRPRADGGVIDPSCTSSSPCIEYDNNGAGPGIRGISVAGNGLSGSTKNKSTSAASGRAGLMGNDVGTGRYNSGVHGLSVDGTGVSGATTNGTGVSGDSPNNTGVSGSSANYLGVYGTGGTYGTYGSGGSYGAVGVGSVGTYGSGTTYGAFGSTSSGRGVEGSASTGIAIYGVSTSGRALEGHTTSGLGLLVTNGSGNGGDISGSYIGVVGRAPSAGFPLIATDPTGANNLFYVDGSGNVSYHGGLFHFASTRSGKTAITYGATTAAPSVEDTGSGQMINGVALVSLDPAFAQTIDPRTIYHVMLTPDGDTRGLYVASKGPTGFVVREVQGGRGSLTFDYHIYATALGHAGERMALMTDAQTRAMSPRAPLVTQRPLPAIRFSPLRPPAQVTH